MKKKLLAVALDAATCELMGFNDGHQVQFADGIPTVDDGLAFYVSQLSSVESKIYETKYKAITYQELIPVDTSDPEWADSFTYFYYDAVTVGKFIGANARDLPRSDISMGEQTEKLFYGGNSYGYSLDELRKSQAMGMPLDTTKGRASYRGFQEHAQRVAYKGDASRGLTGLFNHANVQKETGTVDFKAAGTSGAAMVADCNSLLVKVWQNSAETHVPGVLVLPSDVWAIMSNKRMDSGTDTTALQFLKKNNLYTDLTGQELQVKPNYEAKTAGDTGKPRMMAYELNDENLGMKMPMPWRSLAPQPKGLAIDVPAEYKFGGVFFRYPGAAAYKDLPN